MQITCFWPKSILTIIVVDRIDLLLAHSSSVYPATLLMCEQQRIDIKSVAFFNPAGHRRIMAMRPAWFTEGSVKVYQNKLGRFIFKLFGKSFIKATNSVTVKPESMNNVILSAQTMRYSNFKELDKYLNKLKDTNKPTLWVFSENDRLVEKEIFYEMVDIMGATEKNTQQYDKSGSILSECKLNDLKRLKLTWLLSLSPDTDDSHIRVVVFKSGGHYAFLKYSSEVIQECDKFLNYVMQPADKRSINDPVTPISAPGCWSANFKVQLNSSGPISIFFPIMSSSFHHLVYIIVFIRT